MTAFKPAGTEGPGGRRGAPYAAAMTTHDTEVGTLVLAATDAGLAACSFGGARPVTRRLGAEPGTPARSGLHGRWLDLARQELDEYLAGRLRDFTVPVDLRLASGFDRRVLARLADVGYGSTTSYGALAAILGLPRAAARAVGRAMALNPVLVVVPCHRVVGADGALVGYAGGLPVKRRLLDLESAAASPQLELGLDLRPLDRATAELAAACAPDTDCVQPTPVIWPPRWLWARTGSSPTTGVTSPP